MVNSWLKTCVLAAVISLVLVPFAGKADDKLVEIQKDPLLSAMRAELMRAQKTFVSRTSPRRTSSNTGSRNR